MKKLLPIFFILIFSSCSKEVPNELLVERNYVVYEINSQTPFTGTSTMFYENGQLKERLSYKEGIKNGIQETFFSNGQLESKEELQDGYLNVGTELNYFKTGQLESRRIYTKNGDSISRESYYGNGQLIYKSNILDKDGKEIVEPYVEFFRGGQVKIKFNLDEDKNGTKEYYYSNGNLELEFEVKSHEKHGPFSSYYENGQLKSKGNYKDGKGDGLSESYHENGTLLSVTSFKLGEKDGSQETYTNEGKLSTKTNFKEGSEVGPRESYYETNKLSPILKLRETLNKEGKLVLKEEFYESGRLYIKRSWDGNGYPSGERIGTWIHHISDDDNSLVFVEYHQEDGSFISETWNEGEITETTCWLKGGMRNCEVPTGRSYRNGEESYF